MNLAFQPSRPSPSSLRDLRALCVILSFLFLYLLASAPRTRRNAHNPGPFSHLLHNSRTPRVGGIQPRPSPSVNSVHSALKPTRSSSPVDPFDARAPTPSLTLLSATLTKNRGEGANSASGPCRVVLPWMTASPVQFLNLSAGCELPALSREGSAVGPVAASVSPLSATFTKNLGEGGTDFSLCKLLPDLGGKASLGSTAEPK